MRRVSQILDAVGPSSIGGLRPRRPAYVCPRCSKTNATRPAPASSFSTTARNCEEEQAETETDSKFKPASTSKGLQWVGTQWWYEEKGRPQEHFEGYGPITRPLRQPQDLQRAFLKVLFEVFPNWEKLPTAAENVQARKSLDVYSKQKKTPEIKAAMKDGDAALLNSWASVSLENLRKRFELASKVQYHTGIRLNDPAIARSRTAGDMYQHLLSKEKPAKLFAQLQEKATLADLPNVAVKNSRIHARDRDTAIGRWKVIQKEFEKRGIQSAYAQNLSQKREVRRNKKLERHELE